MAAIPNPNPGNATNANNGNAATAVAATIRTMVVCVADELPSEALSSRQLDRHLGVHGSLQARFWAKGTLHLWQRRSMIDLRKGRPAYCAGGPARLLDLTGMRHAAGMGAGIRHQWWQRAVHGTKPANPWPVYEARHLADPAKYPLDKASADFWNQPRVNAMRMHNALYSGAPLALAELEMYQAGQMAYQHYSASTAIVGDALLTLDGNQLAPASDTMAHRVTFLEQANRYLGTLDDAQRLVAVTL
ncbi:hypothetical protein EDC02_5027 [Micromonospora sp. Llam0]|uniref:hypothetical protein n=1 Tax=Micromonospora sp. Llam0 TaxID=2485143 RepID=UPI000FB6E070|nr:hypothetical protein [Micromonospora sp. Llam0]ROO63017.1 hypothetical protein EDC02_5027 [Micromonospora sp. Llam0]